MDTDLLQSEISTLQDAVLETDQRVDELEEVSATAEQPHGDSSSTPVAPVIDLAQTVGRLEAEVAECKARIQAQDTELEGLKLSISAALAVAVMEPEPEPEVTIAEVEVEAEPEEGTSEEENEARNPNWLERLLLVR